MDHAAAERGADDAQRRVGALVLCLFIGYAVFVVYGSLVPLRFVARPFDDALAAFAAIPFLRLGIGSRADWVANLLLFVPLGFLAAQLVVGERRGTPRLIQGLVLFLAGCVLAAAIEFVQLYFPQRTVSQNDILAESLGGLTGILLQSRWGTSATRFLRTFWQHETGQRRTLRVLHAYLLALLVFNVLPLDLTISPVELYHKWREGRVVLVPFGSGVRGTAGTLYAWITDLLLWLPVGLLWARSGRGTQEILLRGLAASVAVEVAQLFVYSRVTDVTDVLLGAAGCGLGGLIGPRRRRSGATMTALVPGPAWLTIWAGWLVLVLLVFWYPFDFTTTGFSGRTAAEAVTRAPFSTYYFTSEFHAMNEALRRIGFFAPGGVALGMLLASHRRLRGSGWATACALMVLAAVAATVETGQLFLPSKVADLTDALLEFGGAAIGLGLVKWLREGYEASAAQPPAAVAMSPAAPEQDAAEARGAAGRADPVVHLGCVVALALVVGLAGQLPGVPYNVRELVAPGLAGWAAAAGLAVALYAIANLPFVLSDILRGPRFMLFVPLLAIHGLVTWVVLRSTLPLESLHDILGTPILGWVWEVELIGRYLALHMALMLPIVGATLFVGLMLRLAVLRDFLLWLVGSAVLAWPLHEVVVASAATDNLTELMRDGGSFVASAWLAAALFLSATTGSALAIALVSARRRLEFAVVAAVAALLAYWAFEYGTEPYIVKYGRIFSAFQFLLSADRAHYVSDGALLLRYCVAFAAAAAGLALLQLRSWQTALQAGRRAGSRDRGDRAPLTAGTRPAPIAAAASAAGFPSAVQIRPSVGDRG